MPLVEDLQGPSTTFRSPRLDAELKLAGEFGLRNKREIWRIALTLSKIRRAARELLKLEDKDPSVFSREMPSFVDWSGSVLKLHGASITNSGVQVRSRQIHPPRPCFDPTASHSFGKQIVNVPSFVVRLDSQKHIDFALTSPYGVLVLDELNENGQRRLMLVKMPVRKTRNKPVFNIDALRLDPTFKHENTTISLKCRYNVDLSLVLICSRTNHRPCCSPLRRLLERNQSDEHVVSHIEHRQWLSFLSWFAYLAYLLYELSIRAKREKELIIASFVPVITQLSLHKAIGTTKRKDPSFREIPGWPLCLPGSILDISRPWEADTIIGLKLRPGFSITLPGARVVEVSKPEWIEHIQKTNFENYVKGEMFQSLMADLFGKSILVTDGADWKRSRLVTSRVFHISVFKTVVEPRINPTMIEVLDVLQVSSDEGRAIDFSNLFNRFTLDLFVEMTYGKKLGLLGEESRIRNGDPAGSSYSEVFSDAFDFRKIYGF
ncbi:hypothetical protein H4Q26_011150 [Puccinia striiformis f. sp. tritici PST-130]|nr:hypothetical protein H4Q26_011150 [Puccinia striiformis f. sp. tritici PST-130]